MSFLTVENIDHIFFSKDDSTSALEAINMTAEKGEFISILGPSGCGKTTLLSIMAGLLKPTSGKVLLDGESIEFYDKQIGYMLQQDYLFPWKTIEENILIGLKLTNNLNEASRKNAIDLLENVGLSDVLQLYPRQLSGGMRQRVALVRTLATNPSLLLLDEPFSALDYQAKLNLENLVCDLLKDYHKTAILVTHDIGEAISMSDRIYLLSSQPGRNYKHFIVPEELRRLSPFKTRSNENYSILLNEIWKEMEQLEQDRKKATPS